MAHVENVWIFQGDVKNKKLTVNINLKPSGKDRILVDLPELFFDCIMDMAQAAADLHEQKIRAQILSDTLSARINT